MTGEAERKRRNVTLLIGAGAVALGAIIIAMVVMMVVGMGGHRGTGPGTDATPVVVTGDRDLLDLGKYRGIPILRPRQAMELLA